MMNDPNTAEIGKVAAEMFVRELENLKTKIILRLDEEDKVSSHITMTALRSVMVRGIDDGLGLTRRELFELKVIEGIKQVAIKNGHKFAEDAVECLISEKVVDEFTTESPLRAFTEFKAHGLYGIGKGFRPSLAHLDVYLDALERVEGWRTFQIIIGKEGTNPTILFRRVKQGNRE